MKTSRKILALGAAALLCVGLLAGCGNSEADTTGSAPTSSTDESKTTPLDVTYGVVQSLNEDTMKLALYDTDVEITDHNDFSGMNEEDFRAGDETDSVTIDKDAIIEYARDNTLFTGTISDIHVGDMVAVTTDTDGKQEIIVLDAEMGSDAVSTDNSTSDATTGTNSTVDADSDDTTVTTGGTTDTGDDTNAGSGSENTVTVTQ